MAELKDLIKKLDKLEKFLKTDVKTIVGGEAVKHFKQSFRDEGFTDKTLKKWDNVKRRDASSPWYGFKYGKKGISNAATNRKILTGETLALQDSIQWEPTASGVQVSAKTPYAKVQNEGGDIKVFGRKTVRLKPRPFMGDSAKLREKIDELVKKRLDNILKS
ncbi:MAG TPA: phage virion morphogenesis protein [Crocinitomicaceae bacterium]|nr:phage virion morphogenesis protein [Crocinitomicaceae bacterium]